MRLFKRELLGLLVLLGAQGTHAMQPDGAAPASSPRAPELPEQDVYARVFSEQNKRYLASLGYTEQEMAGAIYTARFTAEQRTKPLLKFFEEEKKISFENLGSHDEQLREDLHAGKLLEQEAYPSAQEIEARLRAEKKRDKYCFPLLSTGFSVSFALFWWFFVEFFKCRPTQH